MQHLRAAMGLCMLAVLVFFGGCVDYPPEHTVCLSCETGIEHETADALNVTVESSELHIQVLENGSSRWTVHSNLSGPGVERLRSNASLIDQVAANATGDSIFHESVAHHAVHDGKVRELSARMEEATFVLQFTVPNVTTDGHGKVLLVDVFHTHGLTPGSYSLGTDRVVIHSPVGTTLTNTPPGGTVTSGKTSVVWRASENDRISGHTYLVFAPENAQNNHVYTRATIASAVFDWAAPRVLGYGFVYALSVLGLLVAITRHLAESVPLLRFGRGETVREWLQNRPPVDVPLALLVLVGAVVLMFLDRGQLYGDHLLIVTSVLWFALGISLTVSVRTSRFLMLVISGIPFVFASATVPKTTAAGLVATQMEFTGVTIGVFLFLLLGLPLLFAGYKMANRLDIELRII